MAQKGLWKIAKERMLEDRRVLPKEGGNQLRDFQATHEEIFPSSGLERTWKVKK